MAKQIVGIKFKKTGKTYYFSPNDIQFEQGDGVICETARGVEYGKVIIPNKEVDDSEIVAPLKEVTRKATFEDEKRHLENMEQKQYLIDTGNEKIAARELDMKLVDAELTFDRQKVIFYFTAAGRVDFRDLVKDLASVFHVRIELRQIYERDDIKIRGALAACGRPCCCSVFLSEFEKVSIKMAKLQGLSLNPTKLSGCCGKLMCCLKYENGYYQEMYSKMPKIGSIAITPDGEGIVMSNNVLKQESGIKVTLKDGTQDLRTYKLDVISAKDKQDETDLSDEEE